MAAVVEVEFRTRLEQAIRDINSVEGITASSADAAAKAWIAAEQRKTKATEAEHRKRIKQIEDEAKKAEEAAKSTTEKVAAEANKLGKIGSVIGGPIGGAISLIADGSEIASDGLSDASKSALKFAVGVGAVAAAAAITVGTIYKLGSAALESVRAFEDTVEILGEHDTVVQRNEVAIREAAAALETMDAAESRLGVTLTGMVSPAIEEAGYAVVGLIEGLNSGIQVAIDLNNGVASLSGGVSALEIGLGLAAANAVLLFPPLAALIPLMDAASLATGTLADMGRDAAAELDEVRKASEGAGFAATLATEAHRAEAQALAELLGLPGPSIDDKDAQKAHKQTRKCNDKATSDDKRHAEERARAAQTAATMVLDAQRSIMSGEDQLLAKQQDRLTKFEELAETAKMSDLDREEGRIAILKQNESELTAFMAKEAEKRKAAQDKISAEQTAGKQKNIEQAAKVAEIIGDVESGLRAKQREGMSEMAALDSLHSEQRIELVNRLKEAKASAAEEEAALGYLALTQELERDEKSQELEKAKRDRDFETASIALSIGASVTSSLSDLSDMLFENKTKNMDKESAAYKKAAKKHFAIQKALSITMAVINTAAAIVNMLATNPGPAGVAMAVAAGVLGAVQVGIIAGEQPKFHTGGILQPDEMSVTAQAGEGFLTRAGVASVGGEAGIDRLNSGAPLSSQHQPTMAIINIDGRTVDSFWAAGRKGRNGLQARVEDQIRGQGLKGRSATRR